MIYSTSIGQVFTMSVREDRDIIEQVFAEQEER